MTSGYPKDTPAAVEGRKFQESSTVKSMKGMSTTKVSRGKETASALVIIFTAVALALNQLLINAR